MSEILLLQEMDPVNDRRVIGAITISSTSSNNDCCNGGNSGK